jgi:YD repeat-containing protein
VVTDSGGEVAQRIEYDPWGQVTRADAPTDGTEHFRPLDTVARWRCPLTESFPES